METANLDYTVTGDDPKNLLNNILSRIAANDREDVNVHDGRAVLSTPYTVDSATLDGYRQMSASMRSGGEAKRNVKFPLRIGNISYIDTIPASNRISILFRHDSCIATNYEDDVDEYGDRLRGEMVEHGTHHQPQFYFVIEINTDTGDKKCKVVQAPWASNGRMFPHNNRSRDMVYTSFCPGDYQGQLDQAIAHENLGVFLSVFGDYIMNGTRINDEYGRSASTFNDNVEPLSSLIEVRDLVQGKIMGHVMSDPEHPFNYYMTHQSRGFRFANPAIESIFYDTLCRGRETSND